MNPTETPDLDPLEAVEQGHDPQTDITTEEEVAEATTPEDEQYTPEEHDLPGIDLEGWPDDELVIADLDGIDEGDEE